MQTLPLSALRTEAFYACHQDFNKAALEWPTGIPLTEASARRAVELGLDVNWAANHLLTADEWTAYYEARAKAWAANCEAEATAWAVYDEARAKASAAYNEATAKAWAANCEAEAVAWAAYNEACAIELVKLLAAR